MSGEAAKSPSTGESFLPSLSSPRALLLLTMGATVVGDWTLKAIARSERLPAVQFHVIDPSTGVWIFSLLALAAMVAATSQAPARRPSWIYGGGVAWGGAVANMIELKLRGSVTNFIAVGDRLACPADFAIVLGLAVWWGGSLLWLVRSRIA